MNIENDQATILEPPGRKYNAAQTKGVPVCNSRFYENFIFSEKEWPRDKVMQLKKS